MVTTVFAILMFSPVLIYLVAGLLERQRTVASSEFFLAANQVSSFEFANSSIGYGFQIASVSILFAWGYLHGFGALVNPVFWGVGIVLFGLLLPRMSSYLGSGRTLHGYLGDRYNSRTVEVVASVVTLIAFWGTFVAELAWGSAVFKMFSTNPVIVGSILTGMAIVIAIYLMRAGQLKRDAHRPSPARLHLFRLPHPRSFTDLARGQRRRRGQGGLVQSLRGTRVLSRHHVDHDLAAGRS